MSLLGSASEGPVAVLGHPLKKELEPLEQVELKPCSTGTLNHDGVVPPRS